MTHEELVQFRNSVAFPAMKKLFESTEIPDGFCCINDLSISFFDGRSCGVDSEIKASGLLFKNGKVEEYEFSELDISFGEFITVHQNCTFLTDGSLKFRNDLDEFEITTVMRNFDLCARICPDFEKYVQLDMTSTSSEKEIRFEKMKYLQAEDDYLSLLKNTEPNQKPSLADRIADAAARDGQPSERWERTGPEVHGGR